MSFVKNLRILSKTAISIKAKKSLALTLKMKKIEKEKEQKKLFADERKVKREIKIKKIEFEKNLATLFVQDASGELARNYLALLREQEGARSAAVSSNASSPLQQFAAQFGRPLE